MTKVNHAKGWSLLGAVGLATLGAAAPEPAAAVSYNSLWSASRGAASAGGSTTVAMTPSATTFCTLSRVILAETDIPPETAGCRVYRSVGTWYLSAYKGNAGDQAVQCSATCFNN